MKPLAALLLALALAPAARAEEFVVPLPIDRDALLAHWQRAREARVDRLIPRGFAGATLPVGAGWWRPGDVTLSTTVDRAWLARLAKVYLRTTAYVRFARCTSCWCESDGAPLYRVVAADSAGTIALTFDLARRCVQVGTLAGPGGRLGLPAKLAPLLDLLREAFPTDSALAAFDPKAAPRGGCEASEAPLSCADSSRADQPPELTHGVASRYPEVAVSTGLGGQVPVRVLVGESGAVLDAYVLESYRLLDAPAVEAARRCRFEPARRAGRPVAAWTLLPIRFVAK